MEQICSSFTVWIKQNRVLDPVVIATSPTAQKVWPAACSLDSAQEVVNISASRVHLVVFMSSRHNKQVPG